MKEKSSKFEALWIGLRGGFISSLCCSGPLIIILLFLLLGISSFTLAFGLMTYTKEFIVLGMAFTLISLYLHLKKKTGTCNINTVKANKSFILTALTIQITFFIILFYAVIPLLSPIIYENLPETEELQTNDFGTLTTTSILTQATTEIGKERDLPTTSTVHLTETAPITPITTSSTSTIVTSTTTTTTTTTTINPRYQGKRQLTLKLEGMYCPACTSAVAYSLKKKRGVMSTKVDYATKTAVVIYDPESIEPYKIQASIATWGPITVIEDRQL